MGQAQVKLVEKFDRNGDKRLDDAERKAAREFLAQEREAGRGPRRPGPRGGNQGGTPPTPGPKVTTTEVKTFGDKPLYDPTVVRTFFLEFTNPDWEKELAEFYHTDVEVPAKLTVDGKTYADVGVHFRGASSFFTVGEGRKRSLNLSLDHAHKDQKILGHHALNLLNSHTDPTFLHTMLYYQVAGSYIPTPKASYARVVINGESWGVYVNAEQFNKDFLQARFGTTKGARWKVPGSPRAAGGLAYLGENAAEYKRHYEIKTRDEPKSWAALIQLCKVLNQTPPNKLEQALAPLLDIDGALKFLALENVLINNDGYWIRTSDYSIYQDEKGLFHLIPHDANETFSTPGGPGFGGGQQIQGVELDPLYGADSEAKPLLNKLLAVPALRSRYLRYVRDIATTWLDWNKLGPLAKQYQDLIAEEVKNDTRKLYPFDAFKRGVTEDTEEAGFRGPQRVISLKGFAEQRRAYLLNHPAVKQAGQ